MQVEDGIAKAVREMRAGGKVQFLSRNGVYRWNVVDGDKYQVTYNPASKAWSCTCGTEQPCVHAFMVKVDGLVRREKIDVSQDYAIIYPHIKAALMPRNGNGNGHGSNGNGHGRPKALPPASRNGNGNGRHSRPVAKTSQLRQTPPASSEAPDSFTPAIIEALRAPFLPGMVQWKAQSTTKDKRRALAVAYIDARAVMDRLDAVVGAHQWYDQYRVLRITDDDDSETAWSVECRLTVLDISKTDVGVGEDAKAAFSDSFKRAAVKFGVGRYLYDLPKVWVDYDAQRKQLVEEPTLPDWAMPKVAK